MRLVSSIVVAVLLPLVALAADCAEQTAFRYKVVPNVTYRTVGSWSGRVDLYVSRHARQRPTLFWIHGGGWTERSKEEETLFILPYLADGWSAVVVEYRLADVAPAPAAVQDCRCALAWFLTNAAKYDMGTTQVVISGISAGGHLALTTAGLFDKAIDECPVPIDFKPAVVVNWFGPSDISELASGERPFDKAVTWLAGQSGVAKAISPLYHVSAQAPPILTIHGDADKTIPYSQSLRLHRALTGVDVPNRLVTIHGAHHGDFTAQQVSGAYKAIRAFLRANGVR